MTFLEILLLWLLILSNLCWYGFFRSYRKYVKEYLTKTPPSAEKEK